MQKWKDRKKSYYSPEIESSTATFGRFRLDVHRHITHPPDVWLASCGNLFNQIEMASKDLSQAKIQAKAKLQVILEDAVSEILEGEK